MNQALPYAISEVGGQKVVSVLVNGELKMATDTHPEYNTIVARLFEEDTDGIELLFDVSLVAEQKFKNVSERVAVSGGKVYFDGDLIENELADHLVRLIRAGEDVTCLVNFWEKVATNPSQHSRDNLLRWLTENDFEITEDGNIVGYKGVNSDLTSIHAGPGIVNGVAANGNLDNSVGNVLQMARSSVQHDPSQGCSTGLHVGTYAYARGFGSTVLEVIVNPRDVVSVPTDCGHQKMRVSRYKVGEVVDKARTEMVVSDYNGYTDEEDDPDVVPCDCIYCRNAAQRF